MSVWGLLPGSLTGMSVWGISSLLGGAFLAWASSRNECVGNKSTSVGGGGGPAWASFRDVCGGSKGTRVQQFPGGCLAIPRGQQSTPGGRPLALGGTEKVPG